MNKSEAWEVIAGAMASDAHVNQRGKVKTSYFSINQSGSNHNDWLLVIKDALVSVGIEVSAVYPRVYYYTSRGKPYEHCVLQSLTSPLVASIRSEWYPLGVKEIPEQFRLTGLSLAHMFTGDGSSRLLNMRRTLVVNASLATCGFSERSICVIEKELRGLGIIHIGRSVDKKTKNGSGISINVHNRDVNNFMAIIEPFIVPSYKYKIRYGT